MVPSASVRGSTEQAVCGFAWSSGPGPRAARLSEKLTRFPAVRWRGACAAVSWGSARGSPSRPRRASPPRPRSPVRRVSCLPPRSRVRRVSRPPCVPPSRPRPLLRRLRVPPRAPVRLRGWLSRCRVLLVWREAAPSGDWPAERTQAAPGAALTVHPRPVRSEGLRRRPSPPGPEEGASALRPRRPARHPRLPFPVPTSPRPARPRPGSSPASPTPHSALPFQRSSQNLLGALAARSLSAGPPILASVWTYRGRSVALSVGQAGVWWPAVRDVAQASRALQLRPGVRGLGGGRPPPPPDLPCELRPFPKGGPLAACCTVLSHGPRGVRGGGGGAC